MHHKLFEIFIPINFLYFHIVSRNNPNQYIDILTFHYDLIQNLRIRIENCKYFSRSLSSDDISLSHQCNFTSNIHMYC